MTSPDSKDLPRIGLFRRTFLRWWRPILAVWLLGCAAGLWAVLPQSRWIYRAAGLLRVDPDVNDRFGTRSNAEHLDLFLATQLQLVTSPQVLAATGASPGVSVLPRVRAAEDIVQELRNAVRVSVIPGTYLIEVSMSSSDALEAATIVNAVVDAFVKTNAGNRIRLVNKAIPPGKPIRYETPYPFAFGLIPCAMLVPAFGLFAGIEAWSGRAAPRGAIKPGPAGPPAEV